MMRHRSPHGLPAASRAITALAGIAFSFALTGCGNLLPKAEPPPSYYSLDVAGPPVAPASATGAPGRTLVVNAPRAAAGYDSPQIVYIRDGQRIESFARSAWVDTPAHMLSPLLVTALTSAGWPGVVMPAPTAASADPRARHRGGAAAPGLRGRAQPGPLHAARLAGGPPHPPGAGQPRVRRDGGQHERGRRRRRHRGPSGGAEDAGGAGALVQGVGGGLSRSARPGRPRPRALCAPPHRWFTL